MKITLLFCFTLLLFTACVKEDTNQGGNNGTQQPQTYKDVSYGSDGKQKIDIYLPAG